MIRETLSAAREFGRENRRLRTLTWTAYVTHIFFHCERKVEQRTGYLHLSPVK
jgi:hypothetical protein